MNTPFVKPQKSSGVIECDSVAAKKLGENCAGAGSWAFPLIPAKASQTRSDAWNDHFYSTLACDCDWVSSESLKDKKKHSNLKLLELCRLLCSNVDNHSERERWPNWLSFKSIAMTHMCPKFNLRLPYGGLSVGTMPKLGFHYSPAIRMVLWFEYCVVRRPHIL